MRQDRNSQDEHDPQAVAEAEEKMRGGRVKDADDEHEASRSGSTEGHDREAVEDAARKTLRR